MKLTDELQNKLRDAELDQASGGRFLIRGRGLQINNHVWDKTAE